MYLYTNVKHNFQLAYFHIFRDTEVKVFLAGRQQDSKILANVIYL